MDTKNAIERHEDMCKEAMVRWGKGPWLKEPIRVEFQHAGLQCLINRTVLGHWCGYVGLPKGHIAYGKPFDDLEVNIHGGLTYAEHCRGPICHVTENEDNLYWLGFDCAHAGDLIPSNESLLFKSLNEYQSFDRISYEKYRDIDYVTEETKRLAEQLAAMK